MSIFSNALSKFRNDGQTSRIKNPKPWLQEAIGVSSNGTVRMDERTSLSLSSFYAGTNIIANHVSCLPLDISVRDTNGNTVDPDHQLNEILKYQSSPYQSATHFKKLLMINALVYGNGFALIKRDGNKVTGLYIKEPKDVEIYRDKDNGDIFYKFKGDKTMYHPRDVLHVYDFTLNGYSGLSVLEAGARESFQGHASVQRFSNRYFENNAHIGGVLTTEDSLGTDSETVNEAKSQVRSEFERVYTGDKNWFRTAILEGNWSYQPLDVKASDAMLIERSQATVEDVSRWLQMPLSFLNHTDSQSFKSKEQEAKTYLTNCLSPRIKFFTNELRNKLFLESEKEEGYQISLDTKELTSASLKDTAEFISTMIDRSVFSLNEARDFLSYDTKDELDIHLTQLNMHELGSKPEE